MHIFNSILSSHEAKNKAKTEKAVTTNTSASANATTASNATKSSGAVQAAQANKTAVKSVEIAANSSKPAAAVTFVKAEVNFSVNTTLTSTVNSTAQVQAKKEKD